MVVLTDGKIVRWRKCKIETSDGRVIRQKEYHMEIPLDGRNHRWPDYQMEGVWTTKEKKRLPDGRTIRWKDYHTKRLPDGKTTRLKAHQIEGLPDVRTSDRRTTRWTDY